jgi:nitrate reductase assembly molybdenum cofactor insertion protein NarJ
LSVIKTDQQRRQDLEKIEKEFAELKKKLAADHKEHDKQMAILKMAHENELKQRDKKEKESIAIVQK